MPNNSDPPSIPQSSALSEATPLSLQELFSLRPPYSQQNLAEIIHHMREMREKLAATESSGAKPRQVRVAKQTALPNQNFDPSDMGI